MPKENLKAMKTYQWFRGLLKGSALLSIMFVMQACYGAPHPMNTEDYEEEETVQTTDSIQEVEQTVSMEVEAE